MLFWQTAFWVSLIVLGYAYVAYILFLGIWSSFKNSKSSKALSTFDLPKITHIIAAYNEELVISEKIANTLSLNYPSSKVRTIIVADGSDDETVNLIEKHAGIELFYLPERKGKLASVNRIMGEVNTDVVFFSDANAMLSKNALIEMVIHFQDKKVGAVAGEKVVMTKAADDGVGSGESMYWNYESFIKKCEAKISSTVGAAGELFSIRTSLYRSPPQNALVEDLLITMNVIKQGFNIAYEPKALAREYASENIKEEMKRKVRISAGGIQSIPHLWPFLNPFKYGILSLFLFSHRFLRWLFTPLAMIVLIWSSFMLCDGSMTFYCLCFYSQIIFYILAFLGLLLSDKSLKTKMLFVPFYFTFMHVCMILGLREVWFGDKNINWQKAARRNK